MLNLSKHIFIWSFSRRNGNFVAGSEYNKYLHTLNANDMIYRFFEIKSVEHVRNLSTAYICIK